jgi:hypothetical protein
MIWLGEKRGYLSDWVTQRWVQLTGRSVELADAQWLDGPVGKTTGIGSNFYEAWAVEAGLQLKHDEAVHGLVPRFDALAAPDFDPTKIQRCVADFYERASANGNAVVLMKPVANPDGSFSLYSTGERFGDPGFYFTVRKDAGTLFVRYVKTMREHIRVYEAEDGSLRTDHVLTIWGLWFLPLHYRLRLRVAGGKSWEVAGQ